MRVCGFPVALRNRSPFVALVQRVDVDTRGILPMRYILLWLIGVPIPILLLIFLFFR